MRLLLCLEAADFVQVAVVNVDPDPDPTIDPADPRG